jgi:hypothetical protein
MDYVLGPASKWRGFILFSSNKIGINTSLYLKPENGLLICFPDAKTDIIGGLVARKRA